MAGNRMMEDLKRYRRDLSRRLVKARSAGREAEFWRELEAGADKWYRSEIAAIRREDAAERRQSQKKSPRKALTARRSSATGRVAKRKRA